METGLILAVVFIISVSLLSFASYKFLSRMVLSYRDDVHRRCTESENLKDDALVALSEMKERYKSLLDSTEQSLEKAREAGSEFIDRVSAEVDIFAKEKMAHAMHKIALVGDSMKRDFHKSVISTAKAVIEKHTENPDTSIRRVLDKTIFDSSLDTLRRDKIH